MPQKTTDDALSQLSCEKISPGSAANSHTIALVPHRKQHNRRRICSEAEQQFTQTKSQERKDGPFPGCSRSRDQAGAQGCRISKDVNGVGSTPETTLQLSVEIPRPQTPTQPTKKRSNQMSTLVDTSTSVSARARSMSRVEQRKPHQLYRFRPGTATAERFPSSKPMHQAGAHTAPQSPCLRPSTKTDIRSEQSIGAINATESGIICPLAFHRAGSVRKRRCSTSETDEWGLPWRSRQQPTAVDMEGTNNVMARRATPRTPRSIHVLISLQASSRIKEDCFARPQVNRGGSTSETTQQITAEQDSPSLILPDETNNQTNSSFQEYRGHLPDQGNNGVSR